MKNAVIFLAVAASLVLGSCVRERCSEFPLEIQQSYFPYSDEQVLVFASCEGDTIALNVTEISRSSAYNIYGTVKETCGPNLTVMMEGKVDSIDISIFYYISTHRYQGDCIDGPNPYHFLVSYDVSEIEEEHFVFQDEDSTSNSFTNMIWPFPDTLFLTSISSNPFLDSLIVVKNKGLASFWLTDGQKYLLSDMN